MADAMPQGGEQVRAPALAVGLPARALRYALWSIEGARERLRGAWLTVVIRACGGTCGARLRAGPGAGFRRPPGPGVRLGDDIYLGPHTQIDVLAGARLDIGDGSWFTGFDVISSAQAVEVGANALVAEMVSIRDADHGTTLGQPIAAQPMRSDPIRIGADTWLARGVAVLRGSDIGQGAVIGANSVVRGQIPPHAVAVGAPARVVGSRKPP